MSDSKKRRNRKRRNIQMDKRFRSARRAKARRKKRAKQRKKERDLRVTELYGRQGHRSCGRKVRYPTEGVAQLVMERRLKASDSVRLRAYHCRYCDGWHLTHKRLGAHGPAQDVVDDGTNEDGDAQNVV